MDIMDERLYAVTGWLDSNALIEFDLKTNQAKELISPGPREDGHPLDGNRILDVAADRWANRLWLSVERDKSTSRESVYCLNLHDAKAVPQTTVRSSFLILFQRQGQFLNIFTYTELCTLDLATEQVILAAQHGSWDASVDIGARWQTNMYLSSKFAGNGQVLICTAKDQGGRDHTVWFNANETSPVEVTGTSFPPVRDIRDMGRVHKGLLILTPQSLSLIPGTGED